MKDNFLHEIVATAIIIKDGKYLITRRSKKEKRFPGMWTVPGGRLEIGDYTNLPKNPKGYWDDILEEALKREVKEEVGLEIENIEYLRSLALLHDDGSSSIIISCVARYAFGEVLLQENELDKFKWVNVKEARRYQLLGSIYKELKAVEEKCKDIKQRGYPKH